MAKKTTTKSPARDPFETLRKKQTNGDNYDISTNDIIARLKRWQKLCAFRISSVDYNTLKLTFDTLPKNLDAFIKDAYDLCPDLVQIDEDVDLPMLKRDLSQSKKLTLWWD